MEKPQVRRGKVADIKLQCFLTASEEESAQVKKHIANLSEIDRPDFGLSATMAGMAFAPVAGSGKPLGGFLLTDHQLRRSRWPWQCAKFGRVRMPRNDCLIRCCSITRRKACLTENPWTVGTSAASCNVRPRYGSLSLNRGRFGVHDAHCKGDAGRRRIFSHWAISVVVAQLLYTE